MRQLIEAVAGAVILGATIYDLFQSVILPRPAVGKLRLAPYVIPPTWRAWRWYAGLTSNVEKREHRLAVYAPLSVFVLLAVWGLALILGYGLLYDAVRDQLRPPPPDFMESFYFSATTLLPLSYGDILPAAGLVRLVTLAESATGVLLIAIVVTLLFSLFESFQRREEQVVALDALAGAPPSGVTILENATRDGLAEELTRTFEEWRHWSAAVLESHLAYPTLLYFRSSHDNEAWINSFGAVMDAATLIVSTIEDVPHGPAQLMLKVGGHLVEDFGWYLGLPTSSDPIVEREEFEQARNRLTEAGYRCREPDQAWAEFARRRSVYASPLNRLAHYMAVVPAQWIGDRTYLPHVAGRRPRRRRLPR